MYATTYTLGTHWPSWHRIELEKNIFSFISKVIQVKYGIYMYM